jgi:hypothetical protein
MLLVFPVIQPAATALGLLQAWQQEAAAAV